MVNTSRIRRDLRNILPPQSFVVYLIRSIKLIHEIKVTKVEQLPKLFSDVGFVDLNGLYKSSNNVIMLI